MRIFEILSEGGWETTATQSTVITPATVKTALPRVEKLISGFNHWLSQRDIEPVRIGALTGSSAYHDVDPEDKIYGDIDIQIVVPETEDTEGKTTIQVQDYWYELLDKYIKSANLDYIRPESNPGHPIVGIGGDKWVQVDLMPHLEPLEKWGRYRSTPERGIKGLLMGNMFSVLGELLTMSIQHAGVQFKVRDKVKQPYSKTLKDYELVTLSTDIETFVRDIFDHLAELQKIKNPKVDPLLAANPGADTANPSIKRMVAAVKGLAQSFEINAMYGQGDLAPYATADDFVSAFKQLYTAKAEKARHSTKRDKAETPEARARADSDREKIAQGLETVMGMF